MTIHDIPEPGNKAWQAICERAERFPRSETLLSIAHLQEAWTRKRDMMSAYGETANAAAAKRLLNALAKLRAPFTSGGVEYPGRDTISLLEWDDLVMSKRVSLHEAPRAGRTHPDWTNGVNRAYGWRVG